MQALLLDVKGGVEAGAVDFLFIDLTLITRLCGSGAC